MRKQCYRSISEVCNKLNVRCNCSNEFKRMTKREKANRTAIPVSKHRKAIGQFSEKVWTNKNQSSKEKYKKGNQNYDIGISAFSFFVLFLLAIAFCGCCIIFMYIGQSTGHPSSRETHTM